MIDTRNDLLADLHIDNEQEFVSLDTMVKGETKYVRDLRMNIKNTLKSDNLTAKQTSIIALSIAANEKNKRLIEAFTTMARNEGASDAELAETHAAASLLAVNNVLYRFRHYIEEGTYDKIPARIRMNIMMNPVLGKDLFELVSLAVSAVNGCSACVKSHEKTLVDSGMDSKKIFDSIRLAAIVRGLSVSL
jgi:alkyl hydroperoxide reductase subunit D